MEMTLGNVPPKNFPLKGVTPIGGSRTALVRRGPQISRINWRNSSTSSKLRDTDAKRT